MATITIIVQNAPYQNDNMVWPALRFAGAAMTDCLSKMTNGSGQIKAQKRGLKSFKKCYELGEIDREEFEQRRQNLYS